MSRDFFMGSQKFTFVEELDEADTRGRKRDLFRFECAVCRGDATVALSRGAVSSFARRCAKHRLPSAMLGSKVEAVVIAALGWTVVEGSVLDEMRQEGSAWLVSSIKLVAPVVLRRDSSVVGSTLSVSEDAPVFKLSPKERELLTAMSNDQGSSISALGEATETPVASVRVLMSRLRAKRFAITEHDGWRLTQRGEDALAGTEKPLATPALVTTICDSESGGSRILGLFD